MNPLRLWPFRGGDAATAVADEDFTPWSPRPFRPTNIERPIPLSTLQPSGADLRGYHSDCCWWGRWQDHRWLWTWGSEPVRGETHWLPGSVQVLPASIYPDKEESEKRPLTPQEWMRMMRIKRLAEAHGANQTEAKA